MCSRGQVCRNWLAALPLVLIGGGTVLRKLGEDVTELLEYVNPPRARPGALASAEASAGTDSLDQCMGDFHGGAKRLEDRRARYRELPATPMADRLSVSLHHGSPSAHVGVFQ